MKTELSVELYQKIALTQELRQSIQILQYDLPSLTEFLQEKMLENPTLELEFKNAVEINYEGFGRKESLDFENFVKSSPTIYDYLEEQILIFKFNKEDEKIAKLLLGNLEPSGYLKSDLKSFSKENKLSENKVNEVLKKLKTLEPTGVFSKDLSECLMLQAKKLEFDEITKKIIKYDLKKIAENKISDIAKKYSVEIKDVKAAIERIKSLNPKPGNFIKGYDIATKFIIPDLNLIVDDKDNFLIEFNDEYYPKIYINEYYLKLLNESKDEELSKYLKAKIASSKNIISAIEKRRETILNTANAICNHQKEFILKKSSLKPLRLKDISKEIKMHESTISRAVNGKYIETPGGIFELKDFFQNKIATNFGEIATIEVQNLIKKIISSEDKKRPYSDEKIARILEEKNIKISRRTVAKYRNILQIKNSSERKIF